MSRPSIAFLTIQAIAAIAVAAGPHTITYDGYLLEDGTPATGTFDLRFRCFTEPEADQQDQAGPTIELDDVEVRRGEFTVRLDFGPNDRCGTSGWLETSVARADRIGGFTRLEPLQPLSPRSSGDQTESVPSGAIVFFNLGQCPEGWSEYIEARGRAVVGLVGGGTVGGTYGVPLSNLEERYHQHQYSTSASTSTDGLHNHIWSSIQNAGGDIQWSTYASGGNPVLAFAWSDGIGNDGSGIYPLAASPNATFYTSRGASHDHDIYLGPATTTFAPSLVPYIQLLACQKD